MAARIDLQNGKLIKPKPAETFAEESSGCLMSIGKNRFDWKQQVEVTRHGLGTV